MSWPPIRAVPSVGSRMPQSILITVVFPDPFGPRKPKIDPFPTENETWSTAVKAPKRFVNPSTSIIGSGINRESGKEGYLVKLLDSWIPGFQIYSLVSFHIWKVNIRRHSGAHTIVVAGQTDLHAEYLFDPVSDGLHVAWRKFGLSIDLFDHAIEIGMRKRVHTDADVLAQLD